jgi:GT2 family glycosyltransferase
MATVPTISVVVATCNRPDVLAWTLDSLDAGRQQVPRDDYEIIVADDSRGDETRVLVERRFPGAIYVNGPRRGPASNRNCGASRASGEWLAFIDDDCRPVEGFLQALCEQARSGTVDVIEGCIVVPDKHDSPFRRYVENLSGGNFWSGNLTVRRALFQRLGGFDEEFLEPGGEDMEFGERIRRSGAPTAFCRAATVIHPSHVVSWRYLFWRTFLIKWHLLYLLKTGQGLPPDVSTLRAVMHVIVNRTNALIRTTWRSRTLLKTGTLRTTLFDVVWQWITFPLVLPYLAYWDIQFRRRVRARRSSVPAC